MPRNSFPADDFPRGPGDPDFYGYPGEPGISSLTAAVPAEKGDVIVLKGFGPADQKYKVIKCTPHGKSFELKLEEYHENNSNQ